MNQLTEKQKQRVKRIQRLNQMRRANGDTALPPETLDDIDFLLSLLDSDSQAAGDSISRSEVVARIERQIRLWNNDTVTMACADMLADIKQLPSIDAATSMRDKCVEKVQEFDGWAWCKCSECRADGCSHAVDGHASLFNLAAELSSLTLDQVKPGLILDTVQEKP